MQNEEHLYETYPDLLDGDADPGLLRLVTDLDGIAKGVTSPRRVADDTTRALREHAAGTRRGRPAARFVPARWRHRAGKSAENHSAPPARLAREAQPPGLRGGGLLSRAVGAAGLTAFVAIVAVIALGLSGTLSHMQPGPQTGVGGVVSVVQLTATSIEGNPSGARDLPTAATTLTPTALATEEADQTNTPAPRMTPRATSTDSLPASLRQLIGEDVLTNDDPSVRRVFVDEELGTKYDLTRESGGYTLTLKLAYADANYAYIGYTLAGPADQMGPVGVIPDSTLTDARGNRLAMLGAISTGVIDGSMGILQTFNAGVDTDNEEGIDPRLKSLDLQLRVTISRSPEDPATNLTPVADPMNFDFTVPLQRSRVIEPRQTVLAHGTKATLERVVISPSETRVYVRGAGKYIRTELSTNGGRSSAKGHGSWWWWMGKKGVAADSFADPSFMDERGEWELVVRTAKAPEIDPYPGHPTPEPYDPVEGGPWTFHFTVP